MSLRFACAVAGILLSFASYAGSPCSTVHAYPGVAQLTIENGHLIATLSQYHSTNPNDSTYKQLAYTDRAGWQPYPDLKSGLDDLPSSICLDVPVDQEAASRQTLDGLPDPNFEQRVTTCTTEGTTTWGGISFYGGEGSWGQGGIVKRNNTTGETEILRLAGMQEWSTSHLEYYSGELWIGVAHFGECFGPPESLGLMRYRPRTWKDHTFHIAEPVTDLCGMAVRDMLIYDDVLWVATELGLSRLGSAGAWQNFAVDATNSNPVQPVECKDQYVDLLKSSRLAETELFNNPTGFEDFVSRLNRYRPGFMRAYIRSLHGHPTKKY